MDYIIKQIVIELFEKARAGSSSKKPTALSNFIEEKTDGHIKSRTARRAHKRYIELDENTGKPIPETVKSFCKFLGYNDYEDYVEKNGLNEPKIKKGEALESNTEINEEPEKINGDSIVFNKRNNWIWIVFASVLIFAVISIYQEFNEFEASKENTSDFRCMSWAVDHYVETNCNLSSHPKFKTKVEPLVLSIMKTMKKVKVTSSYNFFLEETSKPLIWYYKTKKGEIEYFTSPGLHPVNGETLKKITPTIIQKYVPVHKLKPDSFI